MRPLPQFSGDNLQFGLALGNLRQQVLKAAGSSDIRQVVQKEIPYLTETSASDLEAAIVPAGTNPARVRSHDAQKSRNEDEVATGGRPRAGHPAAGSAGPG